MNVRTGSVRRWALPLICAGLAIGWGSRELAFARTSAALLSSKTINLSEISIKEDKYDGKRTGMIGIYLSGDSPASRKFATGVFTIDPGKTPHPPHTHLEEEIMIVEKGTGEIFCDGKTTKVGPGSVMFTTPNAPHGIVNTGSDPLTFYFVKWAPAEAKTAN